MKDGSYFVGDAARFFGISRDLVRHYEKTGLVSPSSTGGNGYRRYSFTDLIKLNYVRVLRSYEFGLDDIADFIEARDLKGQAALLAEQGRNVEARIRRLEEIREELECFRKGIGEVARLNGRFELAPSPCFACCPCDAERDPFALEAHERLRATGKVLGDSYSLRVGLSSFRDSPRDVSAAPLAAGFWTGKDGDGPPAGIALFRESRCAHTVFPSRVKVSPEDLEKLAAGLRALGVEPAGDALFLYLAFEKEGEGFVDYIEAWIPVE